MNISLRVIAKLCKVFIMIFTQALGFSTLLEMSYFKFTVILAETERKKKIFKI